MPIFLDHEFKPFTDADQAVVCGHIMLPGHHGNPPIICACTEEQHVSLKDQKLARAQTAQQAADILYPPNRPVGDPESSDPEDNEGMSDPYGYDETANKAFVQGAEWQAAQVHGSLRRIKDIIVEWELAQ